MSRYCDELDFEICSDSFIMDNECDDFALQEEPGDGFAMWQGLVGPHYTPSVSQDGELSWSNNGELPNPPAVNIKGPPGEGLTIKGIATTVAELPAAAEQGDVWLVGSDSPYTGYVCNAGAWVSIGELSVGPAGPQGDDGTTFTPSVSAAGVISWTNDGGKTNPQPVNIKGPQGDPGSPGTPGSPGSQGADGTTFTPSVSAEGVISWTNDGGKQNPPSVNIKGPQGAQGPAGQDAPLPIHFSATINSLPLTISDARILADTSTEESRVIDVVLGTPSALTSDLTWTTASGSVTFSGTLASGGSTTIEFDIIRVEKQ